MSNRLMKRLNGGKIPDSLIIQERISGNRESAISSWEDFKGLRIWTDGSSYNNGKKDPTKPVFGGRGIVGEIDGVEQFSFNSGYQDVTINQMELGAILDALKHCIQTKVPSVVIITDSEYCKKGINEYLANWVKRGWKTSDRKPVKNKDMWTEYLGLSRKIKHQVFWVRGHSDTPFNDRADALAKEACLAVRLANTST